MSISNQQFRAKENAPEWRPHGGYTLTGETTEGTISEYKASGERWAVLLTGSARGELAFYRVPIEHPTLVAEFHRLRPQVGDSIAINWDGQRYRLTVKGRELPPWCRCRHGEGDEAPRS